ncbi:MAG: DUF6538 domain-containing protein [Pseudorhodoplanes sp.]|uniref:DUF6538 domain-containing protein n=1 Tax=Methylocystis sp. TaxID=1911079 RepID=UPI003D153016
MRLPNYLKQSPKTGVFSFRLAVPEKLRTAIGKREVKQSLKTKDHRKALVMAMRLHEEWKGRFLVAEQSLAGQAGGSASALTLYDDTLAWLHSLDWENKPLRRGQVPEQEFHDRMDYADALVDGYQRKPDPLTSMKIAALQGSLKRPVPSVRDAVNLYLQEKNKPGQRSDAKAKQFEQLVQRNGRYLIASLKGDRPLTEVRRDDARKFRDYLLTTRKDLRDGTALSPQTVNRSLQAVRAVFNFAITEWELDVKNPFAGLAIKDAESKRDKRRSFTDAELDAYLSAATQTMNAEAKHCTVLMAYTGARTGEITGLEVQDVKLEEPIPHIVIRPNSTRPILKTGAISQRVVPLLGPALMAASEALAEARKEAVKEAKGSDVRNVGKALFSRYARSRGEDALSALQNKLIRKTLKIADPKLTAYSTRHRMKDKLRNALIDPGLQDAILGHSRGQVSEGYGDGYWLPKLSEALDKALGMRL